MVETPLPAVPLCIGRRPLLRAAGCVLAPLMAAGRAWAANEPPRLLRPGQLSVGTYFVNPPFEFVAKGRRVGFEVDLMQAIARRLRLRPVFVDTRWEVILQEMRDNRYDCIIGGITVTPARERTLAWSAPYMTTTLSLVINSRRMPHATGLANLRDAIVGVQADTTDFDAAVAMQRAGQIAGVRVYPFARIGDAMKDLAAGRIGAVMKVYPVAAWLARETPGLRIIAQVPNDPQPLGIGVSRDNPGLLAAVNDALAAMRVAGEDRTLAARWGLASPSA